jgi:pantoate--beta-alanine ligase
VIIVDTVEECRAACDDVRARGGTVGLVPTMGFFHEGHRSLMRAARAAHDAVVVSLFVNPTQFGPSEDLDAYPRDLAADTEVAVNEDVDVLFAPTVTEMYPNGAATTVHVVGLTDTLCGVSRPGHFDGVTTVVAKLFSIVGPCNAYFGRKDAQQLAVVRRMAADLQLPVRVVGCPLVREPDGVAMSSRNSYLSPEERERATVLVRALRAASDSVVAGERDAQRVRSVLGRVLATEPSVRVDYAEAVDAATMQPIDVFTGDALIAVAAFVGGTRLIDNVALSVDGGTVVVDDGVLATSPCQRRPRSSACTGS